MIGPQETPGGHLEAHLYLVHVELLEEIQMDVQLAGLKDNVLVEDLDMDLLQKIWSSPMLSPLSGNLEELRK